KRRILEVYLNVIEWGPGIYGAQAAADRHFRVPAERLNARQAALLAAALPDPLARNPGAPTRALDARASRIARRAAMVRLGALARRVARGGAPRCPTRRPAGSPTGRRAAPRRTASPRRPRRPPRHRRSARHPGRRTAPPGPGRARPRGSVPAGR